MAVFAYTDASVTVNGVDLSDHARSVNVNYEADELDVTAMSDGSRNRIAGLKSWSVDVEWNQDFAAAEVDATLFSLVGAAAFTITILPTSAAVSATNPSFSGSCILTSYTPLSGSVGDVSTASTTFMGSGDLTRATA